ncbi:hypothetical protein, partial [Paenibacillus sp. P46E]|uniref:hypothetical protein n=1 Tax=Paenibacillus sp. P46E TaxID=1349436 RepID=UPI00093C01FC
VLGATISLQMFKNKMNQEIQSYLLNQRGYTKTDINKIYTQVGKAPLVSTTVIFNDERDNRYFYRKEDGRIYQYSMAPVQGVDDGHQQYKHKEN